MTLCTPSVPSLTPMGLILQLLSDYWPHGEVSKAFSEVFNEVKGTRYRSSYVIDTAGTVRWAVHNPAAQGRDLDEHLRQLHLALDEAPV